MLTTLCGSLSLHPVSLGAAMHRAGYAALGLDFAYVPFAVRDLGGAMAGMRALGIRGFGVSMPYKLDVIPLLDRLTPLAEAIGAVNTVVNEDGQLVGHNTDAHGAVRALQELGELGGARALVYGAGGAARAVAFGLCEAGARVGLANRTQARARTLQASLAERFGADRVELVDLERDGDWTVLVNASSAGMEGYGSASPFPSGWLRPGRNVLDAVYKPVRTELVVAAERAGAAVVHGARMLLHQAAGQFELYTRTAAPLAAMDAALGLALAPTP